MDGARVDPGGASAPERLERLYRAHYAELVGFCRAFVRDRATAEDAAQESFLRACRYLHTFDPARPAWPWLKAIARNVIAARARRAARETPIDEVRGHATDPDTDASIAVAQAWRNLAPRQRAALRLRYIEGLDAERAAAILGIETNALNQLVFRARGRLRGELQRLTEVVPGIAVAPAAWIRSRLHALVARLSRSSTEAARSSDAVLQLVGGLAIALLATGLIGAGRSLTAGDRGDPRSVAADVATGVAAVSDAPARLSQRPSEGPPTDGGHADAGRDGGETRDLVGSVSRTVEDAPRHAGPDFRLVPSKQTRELLGMRSVDPCSTAPVCGTELPAGDQPVFRKIGR